MAIYNGLKEKKNIAKLQTKYLSKLLLTKEAYCINLAGKFCIFAMWLDLKKKYFDIFKSEIFFSLVHQASLISEKIISSFSKILIAKYAKESEAKKINNSVGIHFTNDNFYILMFNKIMISIHL